MINYGSGMGEGPVWARRRPWKRQHRFWRDRHRRVGIRGSGRSGSDGPGMGELMFMVEVNAFGWAGQTLGSGSFGAEEPCKGELVSVEEAATRWTGPTWTSNCPWKYRSHRSVNSLRELPVYWRRGKYNFKMICCNNQFTYTNKNDFKT